MSTFFRHMPDYSLTGSLDRSCEALLEAGEYESDASLVLLVRLQRLVSRSHTAIPGPEAEADNVSRGCYPLMKMITSALRKEMDGLVESRSPTRADDGRLLSTSSTPRSRD